MTRRRKFLLAALLLALIGLAFAQGLPPDGLDPGKPATWFATAVGWGFMVMLAVNLLKANWWPTLHGNQTILVSAALAVGGSLLAGTGIFSFMGVNLEGTLPELLAFGVSAFIASSGGWDTAKRLKAQPSVQAVVDVTANPAANRTVNAVVTKEARP